MSRTTTQEMFYEENLARYIEDKNWYICVHCWKLLEVELLDYEPNYDKLNRSWWYWVKMCKWCWNDNIIE